MASGSQWRIRDEKDRRVCGIFTDPAWCHDGWLGCLCRRAVGIGGAVMRECDKTKCFAHKNHSCVALSEPIDNCPFFKTKAQLVLELGALTDTPPNWAAYRRHSGTKLPTRKDIANWLYRLEEIEPTDDPDVAAKLLMLFRGDNDFVHKGTVVAKIADWLKEHPERCDWCSDPEETARHILEREVQDD